MTPTRRTRKQQQQEEEALKKKTVESTDEESSDAGSVTRCICGEAHNVGLMVQCDKCEVWQHCECIGLIQDKLPDHYYCDQCRPENHQVIKKSNGRSKRLYNAGLVNQDSSPNNSESAGRANKRRKKTPSIAHATIISTATVTTTHTATTTTTTTATLSAATAAVAITTTAIHTDTIRSPKPTSSLSPLISNQHTPSIHSPSSTPPLIQDEPSRTRRTKPAEPIDESPLRKKSPSKPCHSDDSPYWNYSDGRPVRESSPPAKVRYPSSKMSFSDMHRRAKQILDCITKLKSEEPLLKQQKKEIQYLHRPRSLSISSSHSSLSTASTIPLLDECDTIPPATTQEEEEEEVDIATSVTNLLHDGSNSSISSSISSSTSIMSEDSPLTPLPFMATQIKGQESSIDILERMDQKILKFQRKFGILYQ